MRVRVPASSANLGPGFDCFAAALGLFLELDVRQGDRFELVSELDVPRDRSNLAVAAFERIRPAEGWRFEIRSQIPLSGGLGSSAAAVVAGLLAAERLSGPVPSGAPPPGAQAPSGAQGAGLLARAAELEGHPDNVAAALLGGVVVYADGAPHRFEMPERLEALLVVPHGAVATQQARAALPAHVPLSDAVYNTAHGALLILGLATGDRELVARGLGDRVHQPYRAHLYPRSAELLARATELGALGATISGAGPAVLVWTWRGTTGSVAQALGEHAAGWAQVLAVPFVSAGAEVL